MNCAISQSETDELRDSKNERPSTHESEASDRKSLLSRSLISLTDQVVVSGCTFLTMYLVSGKCSQAEVGSFALAATIVNFIRTVQERAIAAPYLAFAFKPGFDRSSFRGSSFVHQGIFALVVAVLAVLVLLTELAYGFSSSTLALTASLAFAIPLLIFRDQIRAISAANFEFVPQLVLDLAIAGILFGGLFGLAWIERFSIASVYVVMGTSCLIPSLIWLWLHRQILQIDHSKIASDWRHNWLYSRWLVGARVLGILGYLVVPWMVTFFMGKAATGAFAVCSSLVGISLMFLTGMNNFLQPRTIREFHRSGVVGLRVSLFESIAIVSGVLTVITIGLALRGNEVLGVLFGASYGTYGHIAFLLSLSTLSVSFSIMFGNGLAALGNSRSYFWGEFACCVVSVTSAVVLIPLWGLSGAAQALIFGGLASSVVTGLTLARAISLVRPLNTDSSVDHPVAMNERQL